LNSKVATNFHIFLHLVSKPGAKVEVLIPLVQVVHAAKVVLQINRQILEAVQVVLQVEGGGRHLSFCAPRVSVACYAAHMRVYFSGNQENNLIRCTSTKRERETVYVYKCTDTNSCLDIFYFTFYFIINIIFIEQEFFQYDI